MIPILQRFRFLLYCLVLSRSHPEQKVKKTFILLEQIIEKNIGKLFVNYEIESVFPYRIMRNADLSIEEDEAADLLIEID